MNTIEFGDCRETMRRWAEQGVKAQMCVISPPYFGLRDYGHEGQIGLEQRAPEYVAGLVEVFECVGNVLADDGVLFVNIGDSYASSGVSGAMGKPNLSRHGDASINPKNAAHQYGRAPTPAGCKPKDLIGIPWLLAFALRADGWYLRQDIIWHKPNPMPESVRDRCTKAHEYIFLLSKSERYFFDSEAMREPSAGWPIGGAKTRGKTGYATASGAGKSPQRDSNGGLGGDGQTRNRRSVWTVPTRPYKGAHFATFPPALIEPCILAGSQPGDIVLDPFMGSGTTAAVAIQHGRQYLGCELNPEYGPLRQERIRTLK